METPSKVLVPRPISSKMIRLFSVALCKMEAVSCISTMKVDCPELRSSYAPTRVKIRSTIPNEVSSAGTKLPIWASSTINAVWRMMVDLPAIFGPVRIIISPSLSMTSLAIKDFSNCSTTGCRPFFICSIFCATNCGRT